jgi:hypothetical protein
MDQHDLDGLFDPTGESVVERKHLAPRVATLAGKRIGLLINTKPSAEPLLRMIQELLRERYRISEFREARTKSSRAAPMETIQSFVGCDVVINAIGD